MLSPTSATDSTSLADDPLTGQPYRALQLLGAGSMGEVFLAEHRSLATPCVVKIQHTRLARDPSIADRIRREAESLSRLNHPNIVAILGSGRTVDERPYIVMEYLRGQTMADEFAARGQLPPLEALSYVCQLLRGLAAAHAVGIVHRDIKPDNLFLCDGPRESRVLKVLDFGVACPTPNAPPLGVGPLAVPTATGTVVGALRYVSPEGALARRVDHRADLYSAALVLYFALAGRGPFDHIQSALLLLSAHVAEEPDPPSRFCKAAIPIELDQAVLRALRKAPGERFQSADELREELSRIMETLKRDASHVRRLPDGAQRDPDASGSRIRSARSVEAEVEAVALEQSGPLRIGSRFLEKYEIRERIGRGGQAFVYHGQHIFTGREVAIKVVHSHHGMTREMLERGKAEARALGKLDHSNIVVMHDAGVTNDGLFYIVMELLRGRSLRSALSAHGRFSIAEVLQLSTSVAEALQAAHDIGLIHRDLTPDNVYLTRNNRVKVLDFGIAKVLNEIGFTTHKDIVMGSILYMSPEQVQGLPLTPRSDICALGLLMFEMLLGQHPSLLLFERDLRERNEPSRRAELADIPPIQALRVPPLLSDLDPSLPLELAQLVSRAIAKDPADRFSTMRELLSAIRACQEACRLDAPVTLPRAFARDLSLRADGESENEPASQRRTPRCGLIWDGAGSLTPVPTESELLAVTTAISGPLTTRAEEGSLPFRTLRSRRSVAWFRTGLIACSVFAVALGSLGVLRHFAAAKRVDLGTPSEVGRATRSSNSTLASLSPALPVNPAGDPNALVPPPPDPQTAEVTDVTRAPSSPPLAVLATRNVAPTARFARSSASASASASATPVDKITDVSRALEIELGRKHHADSTASTAQPRKRLNGGKLIYGD